jgi:hypothetical protein
MQHYSEGDNPSGWASASGLAVTRGRIPSRPYSHPRKSYRMTADRDAGAKRERTLPASGSEAFIDFEGCGKKAPSCTWSSSEGAVMLNPTDDDDDDRGQFVDEYNRLAKKVSCH